MPKTKRRSRSRRSSRTRRVHVAGRSVVGEEAGAGTRGKLNQNSLPASPSPSPSPITATASRARAVQVAAAPMREAEDEDAEAREEIMMHCEPSSRCQPPL